MVQTITTKAIEMTAKEFRQIWLKKVEKEVGERKFISYMMGAKWECDFAEDYHKAKVEAINDKDIIDLFIRVQIGEQSHDWFIKKLKEQLLKQ